VTYIGNLDYHGGADWLRAVNDHSAGFKTCPTGRHWGPQGAAGVLPWCVWSGRIVVLLGRRSAHVQQGSCWSTFGGAIDPGETTADAAGRELAEEVSGVSIELTAKPAFTYTCQSCHWSYATHLGRVLLDQTGRLPVISIRNDETEAVWWVLIDEVTQLNLHPKFAEAWPILSAQLIAAAKAAAS
jgi:8-oxo-dGTP diphosphatase